MLRRPSARRHRGLLGIAAVAVLLAALCASRPDSITWSATERRNACATADAWLRSIDDGELASAAEGSDELAEALERRGRCLGGQGRYSEAQHLLERSLAIREQRHGPDHASVAAALNALGWLHVRKGRFMDADDLYRRALSIETRTRGTHDLEVARTQAGLAYLRFRQERFDESKRLALASLRIRERALGPRHLAVAESVNLVGLVDLSRGRLLEARFEFERALAIHDALRGQRLAAFLPFPIGHRSFERLGWLVPEHPDKGSILSNLASVLIEEGQLSEAARRLEQAVEVFERTLEPEHPYLGDALNNLGSVYQSQARSRLAEQTYQRSIEIFERSRPFGQLGLALALQNLGALQTREGRFHEARANLERSIALSSQLLDPDHPHLQRARRTLEACAVAQSGGAAAG